MHIAEIQLQPLMPLVLPEGPATDCSALNTCNPANLIW